jgi:glycosyl transferase family 25
MSFLNTIVDKVYVINLDKDTTRFETISKQLESQHISFERFSAINGKEVKNDSRLTQFCNSFCTKGIKGCALSHRTLWESMIKNDYETICVLEDDAVLSEDFNEHLQLLYGSIPNDFDIVYLGSHFYCGDTSLYNRATTNLFSVKNSEYSTGILKVSGCGGFHGYILSKKGAKKITSNPINFHVDIDIMNYNLEAYAFHPVLISSGDNNSNLSNDFPPLLLSALSNIAVTNQPNNKSLSFILSENLINLGIFPINALIILIFVLAICFPLKYYYILYIWLFIELLISRDIPNALFYGTLLSIPFFIKYYN